MPVTMKTVDDSHYQQQKQMLISNSPSNDSIHGEERYAAAVTNNSGDISPHLHNNSISVNASKNQHSKSMNPTSQLGKKNILVNL
jgi:hypothetical protein